MSKDEDRIEIVSDNVDEVPDGYDPSTIMVDDNNKVTVAKEK